MPEDLLPHDNLSERQLKIGYWYVTHKNTLKRIGIILLIILDIIFLGYGIYGFTKLFYIEQAGYDKMIMDLTKENQAAITHAYFEKNKPENIIIGNVSIINAGQNKYDLAVKVKNPNSIWLIESLDYYFIYDGVQTGVKKSFIFTNEEKYLIFLALSSPNRITNAMVVISNVKWKRDKNFADFYKNRVMFTISNIDYKRQDELNGSSKNSVSQAYFTAINNSAYNYWQVGFAVLLKRGMDVVGINYIYLDQFKSGDEKNVTVSWFEALPMSVNKVEIVPEVNILDEGIYMAP